ncbi:hypothetical protein Trydic_g16810 [Trypoxylus dichotomus]
MYYTKVLSLFVLVIIFSEGLALNCYECLGPPRGGCATANPINFVKIPCDQHKFLKKPIAVHMELENAVDFSVFCVQATVLGNNATIIERGCGFVPEGVDFCQALKRVVKVKSCSTCTKNYCNNKTLRETDNNDLN